MQGDPEKRELAQTLLLTGPIVGPKPAAYAPTSCQIRLQRATPSLSRILQPPRLDHGFLPPSLSDHYNDPPGD